jgi:hypothetical protein
MKWGKEKVKKGVGIKRVLAGGTEELRVDVAPLGQ